MKITVHVGHLDGIATAKEQALAAAGPDDVIEIIVAQPTGQSPVERQEVRPATSPAQR